MIPDALANVNEPYCKVFSLFPLKLKAEAEMSLCGAEFTVIRDTESTAGS